MNDVTIRNLLREGFDAGRIKPGIRLSETETALVFACDQPRTPAGFLLRRALHDDGMRSEQIDMHRRRRRHSAAVACDFMHHDRGFGHAETRAAKFFRHRDAEPAGVGHRAMKLKWKYAVIVACQPVVVAEAGYDRADAFPDRAVIVRWLEFVGQQ